MSILTKYLPETEFHMSLQTLSDGELIREFTESQNDKAFDTLLRRHYQQIHRRLTGKLRDEDKAHDLCQTLWMRVLNNLPDYKDDQKFEHYLNTIASNLLKDHWRGDRSGSEVSLYDEEGADASEYGAFDEAQGHRHSEQSQYENRQAIDRLITQVIPSLPCDQRLVYLLRHESEFWDGKQPMQWQHIAEMNDMEVDHASEIFFKSKRSFDHCRQWRRQKCRA